MNNFSVVSMDYLVDNIRSVGIWSIVLPEMLPNAALLGAALNVTDYLGQNKPILVCELETRLEAGEVFQDVFLLDVEDLPRHLGALVMNDRFVKRYLLSGSETAQTMVEQIHVFFNTEDFRHRLGEAMDSGGVLVGVCGTSAIHISRGMREPVEVGEDDEARRASE